MDGNQIAKWSTALLVLALNACAPQKPTTDILIRALQGYYDSHPVCAALALSFPAEVQDPANDPYGDLLAALASAGFAKLRSDTRSGVAGGVDRMNVPQRYELTAAGRRVIHPNPDKFLEGSELCYARRYIKTVQSFSPNADIAGKIGRVDATYTFDLQDLGPWVAAPAMQRSLFGLAYITAPGRGIGSDILILTDSGWKVEMQAH